ncbi:hypothetical protein BS78_K155700 [Paspalum vaginatum]|uniref:Uncharacterized protein n=1 Tax=Paspalum vaginatum TaxID=158149 RepID=A0A9W8CFT6_9POAL|nr:hypothetical protein BS78_K155700 [Paspalum vaginatum]
MPGIPPPPVPPPRAAAVVLLAGPCLPRLVSSREPAPVTGLPSFTRSSADPFLFFPLDSSCILLILSCACSSIRSSIFFPICSSSDDPFSFLSVSSRPLKQQPCTFFRPQITAAVGQVPVPSLPACAAAAKAACTSPGGAASAYPTVDPTSPLLDSTTAPKVR